VLGNAGGGSETPNIKVIPTDIKVIFEQEDKEYTAFLAATDTKLDLAFLKIEGLGDRKLTAVDFAAAAVPTLGEQIVTVSRLRKGFDYAPYFETARISGVMVGNVVAEERVEIAPDGRMVGDLTAPKIIINDGAAFRGRIDMQNFDEAQDGRPKSEPSAPAKMPATGGDQPSAAAAK